MNKDKTLRVRFIASNGDTLSVAAADIISADAR